MKETTAPQESFDVKRHGISWTSLALMAFMTVWGFGNVINGYGYYHGIQSIVSWVIIFALYFIPYSLMVGEMGSAFRTSGGGVSSWVEGSYNKKLAYLAGWTYWVVHMPYISQKPLNAVIAAGWAIWGDKRVSTFNVVYIQLICILIFFFVLYLTQHGVSMVKKVCSVAGAAGLVMSFLFILMALSAPMIRGTQVNHLDLSFSTLMPDINLKYITNFSILIFAVGGCEKISPYVNKMKEPGKGFPKGIIFMTVMVCLAAILGAIALGLMFDPLNPPEDFIANGAYEAFQKLGNWYGVGNFFVVLYACSILLTQVAVMVLSIDAPLRILIESTDEEFIPASLKKTNKNGSYINGIKMIAVIVLILLIIPMLGIGQVNEVVKFMIKLNSVCMPLRYLWVFFAYIGLKKLAENKAEYVFTKNRTLGKLIGGWCFALTAASCLFGMYSDSRFKMVMNFLTPFILLSLGLIMPRIAKKQREQA